MKCADIALGLTLKTNINLFFALLPDRQIVPRIVSHRDTTCGALAVGGSRIRAEHLHLTLVGFHDRSGNADIAITKAGKAAGRIRQPLFRVQFDVTRGVDVQRTRYPFVLQSSETINGCALLSRSLIRELEREGLVVRGPVRPHMTMAWGSRLIDEEFPLQPIAWIAREFVLVESHVGETRHEYPGRWPLWA